MLPEEKTCNKKASLSKRMKELVESQKYRVLVFKNGDSRDCAEVVCNRFDEVNVFRVLMSIFLKHLTIVLVDRIFIALSRDYFCDGSHLLTNQHVRFSFWTTALLNLA